MGNLLRVIQVPVGIAQGIWWSNGAIIIAVEFLAAATARTR